MQQNLNAKRYSLLIYGLSETYLISLNETLDNFMDCFPRFISGAVGKIRSQGICGSCYAYAVTGAIQSAYYLKVNNINRHFRFS